MCLWREKNVTGAQAPRLPDSRRQSDTLLGDLVIGPAGGPFAKVGHCSGSRRPFARPAYDDPAITHMPPLACSTRRAIPLPRLADAALGRGRWPAWRLRTRATPGKTRPLGPDCPSLSSVVPRAHGPFDVRILDWHRQSRRPSPLREAHHRRFPLAFPPVRRRYPAIS